MSNPNPSPITIKTVFSTPKGTQEIRRFGLNLKSSDNGFDLLTDFLFKTYGPSYNLSPITNKFIIRYEDDDGDLCSISSDIELLEAIRLANEQKKPLKILISLEEEGAELISIPQTPASTASSANNHNGLTIITGERSVSRADSVVSTSAAAPVNTVSNSGNGDSDNEYVTVDEDKKVPAVEAPAKSSPPAPLVTVTDELQTPPISPHGVSPPSPIVIRSPLPVSEPTISLPATSPAVSRDNSLEDSAVAEESIVHTGVICDGCNMSPIVGARFKCTKCADYDLCEKCEASGVAHPISHVMMKIRAPLNHSSTATACANARRCTRPSHPIRPKAEFISDVTLADGIEVEVGSTCHKVWSIRNSGPLPWPTGTQLVFVGGDLLSGNGAAELGQAVDVPTAAAGHIVHISVDIIVPNEPGRYRATFRLQTPTGEKFGPRIWLDIIAKAKPEAVNTVQQPAAALPVAVPVAKQEEGKYSAPTNNATTTIPVAAPVVVEQKVVEAPKPKPAPANPHAGFKYAAQLERLLEMGFNDVDLNKYLLVNNGGDEQKVISWILTNSPSQ